MVVIHEETLNLDDGLNKDPKQFPNLAKKLELQNGRKTIIKMKNPKHILSLTCSPKTDYKQWTLPNTRDHLQNL